MVGRLVRGVGTAVLACGMSATAMLVGPAPAGAVNEYEGQTYADAVAAIRDAGQSAAVRGKVGSFLPLPQCVVTGSRTANILDSSGSGTSKVYLDLNCNYMFALPGVPGNSRASEEGKAAYEQALEQAQQQQEEAQAAQQAEAEKAAAEAAAGG